MTHTPAQVEAGVEEPVSYVAIGPVFSTRTKATGYREVGLPLVAHAAAVGAKRGLPVVGIGGITLDTAMSVMDAGAAALAVITDLVTADPEERTRQYLSVLC